MDDSEVVVVDFVFPQGYEARNEQVLEAPARYTLSRCTGCGSKDYVLRSELKAEVGIPASRMFECTECGTYRLG